MRKCLLLFIIFFAVACNSKTDAPAKLLSRDKMEDILWDLMRADLFINNYMLIKDTALDKKKQGIELYSQILKLHKVSQEQFRESFIYYRSQPEELKVLMDSLSHHSDSAQLQKSAKTPTADSLPEQVVIPEKKDTGKKKIIPVRKIE
ncbi:MAG TPA: DUF4296 domain-containing protein [Chitinophagaceae bacterium]|nr:DUF4296 domain-containing protein [Chitinophagaceae bacterium]HPH32806.1 DUF4296 domain-containing protein [Chitinophagaceae bacterium]HPN59498.1 DUF4296 domain-containing protein [Chitinophagaceae bacterium]